MQHAPLLDVAIVGGGIGGIVHLHYARRAGLTAVVLEAQEAVGGLWRMLPAWQDIQIWTLLGFLARRTGVAAAAKSDPLPRRNAPALDAGRSPAISL